jgi:hypothetical protein
MVGSDMGGPRLARGSRSGRGSIHPLDRVVNPKSRQGY